MGGGGGELQRAAGEGKGATGICLVLRGKEKDCLITNLWQSYSRCGYLAQNPWKQRSNGHQLRELFILVYFINFC